MIRSTSFLVTRSGSVVVLLGTGHVVWPTIETSDSSVRHATGKHAGGLDSLRVYSKFGFLFQLLFVIVPHCCIDRRQDAVLTRETTYSQA